MIPRSFRLDPSIGGFWRCFLVLWIAGSSRIFNWEYSRSLSTRTTRKTQIKQKPDNSHACLYTTDSQSSRLVRSTASVAFGAVVVCIRFAPTLLHPRYDRQRAVIFHLKTFSWGNSHVFRFSSNSTRSGARKLHPKAARTPVSLA